MTADQINVTIGTASPISVTIGTADPISITLGGSATPLPDQTGNANKYLKTDGTNPSWATVAGGGAWTDSTYLDDLSERSFTFTHLLDTTDGPSIEMTSSNAGGGTNDYLRYSMSILGGIESAFQPYGGGNIITARWQSLSDGLNISVGHGFGLYDPIKVYATTVDVQGHIRGRRMFVGQELTPLNTLDVGAHNGDNGSLVVGTDFAGIVTAASDGILSQNFLGIGHPTPLNSVDIGRYDFGGGTYVRNGAMVIGTAYAGVVTAPDNSLMVQGSIAAGSTVTGSNLSGTNTGDQTITLTGDVTGSGTSSFAATIGNSKVTYAKIQNVSATDKVLGRVTAGSGVIEEIATTGSGNVVRATSPTLVTPVLGTPSSGTLTNCTGLPVSGITASTSTALGVGSIELGHASDTTLARVSAGVASIEGVTIATSSNTLTFTNKSISESQITFTDITTGNASTSNHGYLKKLPNSSTQYLNGVGNWVGVPVAYGFACSDETTALTTGTAKVTVRVPHAMTVTAVRASVNTAPTGSTLIVDINKNGTTIMATNKLSIDASEKTSTTAATAAGVTTSALSDDDEITIDIDQVGSTIAGKGLKVWLIGTM